MTLHSILNGMFQQLYNLKHLKHNIKFHVGYMTHPSTQKDRTHRYQVIKYFELSFKRVTIKSIKNELTKRNVSVLSLIMSYDNRKPMMYEVIEELMYHIIDNYICLDYLGFIQEIYPT